MNKQFNAFLIVLFLAVVFVPLVFSDKMGGKVLESENRTAAMFPDVFDENGKINYSIIKDGIEPWINDNAYGRKFMQGINRRINFYLFKQDNTNEIMYGKDKWIYLLNENNVKKIQKTDYPSKEDSEKIKNNLIKINEAFNEKGIEFCVNVFPNKINLYPEYLNNTILEVNDKDALYYYKELSKQLPELNINNLYDDMIAEKEKTGKLLYFKAVDNNHWNNFGAFLGYKSVMNNAKKRLPELKVLTENDFDVTEYDVEAKIFSDDVYTVEKNYDYKLKTKRMSTEDKEYFNRINFYSDDAWQSFNYYKNENQDLPKAIIIGDSYTWMFMLENYGESFSELVFLHDNDKNNLNKVMNFMKPDIIMFNGLSETVTNIVLGMDIQRVSPELPNKYLECNDNWLYLDYVNGISVENNNPNITINTDDNVITLDGWGVDRLTGEVASNIYVKVGNELYWVNYGNERAVVVDFFPDRPNWLNSGFDISLDKDKVVKAGGFSIYLIGNDGSYSYKPIEFKVTEE